jgi:hypothetical protein
MIVDKLLSDYDDDLKRNKSIDLNFSHNDLWLDDIELNRVEEECNHHVLRIVILVEWISDEDDQQNDLIVWMVLVELGER